jgi:hypothetical protein
MTLARRAWSSVALAVVASVAAMLVYPARTSFGQAASDPLVGTWRFITYELWDARGNVQQPLGAPSGYIVFDRTGHAFVQLMEPKRALTFGAYYGAYRVNPILGQLTVAVEGANAPDMLATQQVRPYRITGDTLILGVAGEYRATLLRVRETTAAPDTVSILGAVASWMRTNRASGDSVQRARCAEGDRSLCPAPYPHQPVWYLPPDSAGLAADLARIDSVPARSDARLPSCPWPANAPAGSGYQARVGVEFEGETRATVTVRLACKNPSGYLHDVYKLDRTYEVTRTGTEWKAQLIFTRVT